jgi:hypothetical protein
MVAKTTEVIEIVQIEHGVVETCILGTTPMIMNAMSGKVRRELLLPRGRKTAAEKKSLLKHAPLQEFQDSMVKMDKGPTAIGVPAPAFKAAMRGAAVDLPGSSKAQIGRLVQVSGYTIGVYGVPQLHMSVVRSADINKTPDIRTRAILPQWCCKIEIRFTKPMITQTALVNLLAAAGFCQGIGDWRPEKGKGDHGQFKIVSPKDPEFTFLTKNEGRAAQLKAIQHPACYDSETEDLLNWYEEEVVRRGRAA